MDTNYFSDSPYVGLQPFTIKDQKYFFGRERDSRIISSNLFAAPLTVLYGSSGVGKSSILQAGVIPLLRKSPRTAVVSFQRWPEKDPIQILKTECLEAIRAVGCEGVQINMSLAFDEFLFQAIQVFHGTILIILDQFEEYFLYHREEENSFDAEFARAVNREDIDANFLIALREDSLSMLDRFRTRIPNLLGNSLRLRHLDEHSAREAICKPLEVYNQDHADKPQVSIEEDLVKVLIRDVRAGKLLIGQGGEGGIGEKNDRTDSEIRIEAPFLQLILIRLWDEEMRQGSNSLRLETLNKLGGASRIVRTHLDNAMSGLQREKQEIAANIYRFLVTPSGTKIAYAVGDLAYYAGVAVEKLEPVLDDLAQGDVRILRRVALPGEPSRYEIFHDVLAPAILDWRSRYEKDKDLSKKLDVELAKARQNTSKQIRALLLRALWGAVVDIIWMIIGGVATAIFPLLALLLIIPAGGFAFTRGLRKVAPQPLSKKQNRNIILWWGAARVVLVVISFFVVDKGMSSINSFVTGILITVGLFVFLFSGPIGGLGAYWRIQRQGSQLPAASSSSAAAILAS